MILPETLHKILTESGFIDPKEFDSAVKSAKELNKPVTDVLVFRGLINEDALGKLIAEHYGVPFVSLKNKLVPLEILQLIPEQAALSYHVIPFDLQNEALYLGMENPQDVEALEFVKRKTGRAVVVHYMMPGDFKKTIGQYKRNIKKLFNEIINENVNKANTESSNVQEVAQDVPVIKILDTILEYASAEGASDIHLELLEDHMQIRFRVDGILRDIATLPKTIHPGLVARIKILSSLKIDEHRLPQDGRFKFKIHESDVALRVSILPAFFGENVVMRLLPESARTLSLEELGVSAEALPMIRDNIRKSNGMVLVTGPTGSGKTTTLYTLLNILNTPGVKLCTVEDPVEYGMRRINQTQINPAAGLTFAAGLRSLLRHDPDIIMIGEIRDDETAEIAIHSALTGHMVLSTLHTNSAAGAIPRFLDMSVQPFLVASTINLVVAQRLIRKICPSCIKKIEPSGEMLQFIDQHTKGSQIQITDVFEGAGCDECSQSGYKGRIGIYEILQVNKEIRELINNRATEDEINTQAVKDGMTSLLLDGLNKVGAGLTTVQEVIRATSE